MVEEGRKKRRELILAQLRARVPAAGGPGCFLCGLILKDIELHEKITGYPKDSNGADTFPRAGKLAHIRLEGFVPPD